MIDTPLLRAQGVHFRYVNARGVQDLDLRLERGEILGLLGLNGAGKSTTLRLLAGTLTPDRGTVTVVGQKLRTDAPKGRQFIGYLPENAPLYSELTVNEQLIYCARLFGMSAKAARFAAAKARVRCGLDGVGRRRVQALSQGMRRRLGLAQAIVHDPAVILLDEPTVALDPVQIVQVRDLIRDLGQNSAVILSSHLLHEVESVCTRVAILHEGRLVHEQALPDAQAFAGVILGLKDDPGVATIQATLPDVSIRALGLGRYLIEGEQASVPRLAELALQRQWGLREIQPHMHSLEQRFLALTRGTPEHES